MTFLRQIAGEESREEEVRRRAFREEKHLSSSASETERTHLWRIIVSENSWDREEEMQMPCCWQHHGSDASMCVAYWMIMTKRGCIPCEQACGTMITDWPACPWASQGTLILMLIRAAAQWNISVLARQQEIRWSIPVRPCLFLIF